MFRVNANVYLRVEESALNGVAESSVWTEQLAGLTNLSYESYSRLTKDFFRL